MMTETLWTEARRAFSALGPSARPTHFGQAPGRVELLGNHTDYNGGLVMSAAINRRTLVVGSANETRRAVIGSAGLEGAIDRFTIDAIDRADPGHWSNYVRGVAWSFIEGRGALKGGFHAGIAGDVPLGTGLSSSASLEAALALFLLAADRVPNRSAALDDAARLELAHLLRHAENAFVGVASGLLDQFSSLFGRADHALFLDCRTLDHERVPLGNPAPTIVVCDSRTSRRLADGMYNQRRAECERVVAHFRTRYPERTITQLRDLTIEDLESEWNALDPIGRKRARHVVTENLRVRAGVTALKRGDLADFGRLMSESHASSRDDFENSSKTLDALIGVAATAPGFLGGKLSGAGWAGCTVNLVRADQAEDFGAAVREGSQKRLGIDPEVHLCRATEGASGGVIQGP